VRRAAERFVPAAAAPAWQVWTALWTIYLAWGSTYLAMRVMVRTLPPFYGACARFLVAGLVLAAWVAFRHGPGALRLTRTQVVAVAVTGLLLPGLGNGLNTLAARHTPSAMQALLNAAVPLWVILLRLLARDRVRGWTLAGTVAGLGGLAVLLLPGARPAETETIGVVVVLVATFCWALGSMLSVRLDVPRNPLSLTALQMLFGAVVLAVLGAASGETAELDPGRFSGESLLALAYLTTVGAIVAYSAYTWLLHHGTVSQAVTYGFVNPIIAVVLGWAILSEELTWLTLVGAAIVVAAVAAVVRHESARRPV
jgi:drug/metabolite transporter (DMT)-like permease